MIKIDRSPAPPELTPEIIEMKTNAFKANHGLAVWKEPYIMRGLLNMTHSKCCYCECRLDEESKYMEVEHFHHKEAYENEVVLWDNLLPSCKKCNDHKGDHDTVAEPIIDPSKQDPKDHLVFYSFQIRGKTDLGKTTEDILNLNDSKHHVLPRFRICNQLTDKLNELLETASSLTADSPRGTKTRFRNRMIRFLEECQPNEPYTAVKATTVVNDKKYSDIIIILQALGMWSEPLVSLDQIMRRYQLDIEK